jgi:hypothetical protein
MYVIFLVILAGCAWSSFKIGHNEGVRAGAESTIEVLHITNLPIYDRVKLGI